MFPTALQTICLYACGLPGDVEEWKANAVLDEDGKVFHIQHWFAEEDVDREGAVRMTT